MRKQLNLKYLGSLPVDRHVAGVNVSGAIAPYPGCLVKFALRGGGTETILVISGPAKSTYGSLLIASQLKYIAPLSDEDHEALLAAMPEIADADWDMNHDQSRVAAVAKLFFDVPGIGFEYVMQDGSARRYWLPTKVARFYGEYLNGFKSLFENHQNADPDEPVVY